MDLFTYAERYPHVPGHRGIEPSVEASEVIKPTAAYLQSKVIAFLKQYGPSTSREISAGVGVEYASIQPRTSELKKLLKIRDSGKRKKEGRVSVTVWEAA